MILEGLKEVPMKKIQMILTAAAVVLFSASFVLAAPGKSGDQIPINGIYVVAEADTPQSGPIVREERPIDQSLEKGKAAAPEEKSDRIRVFPAQPPDNVKSAPERKDENKFTPPDRF